MLLVLAIAFAAQAATPAPIEGTWRSPGGNSIITIAECGNSLCGTVAWASAKAQKDSAKTTGQLVGTQVLTALKQDKKGRWHGKLFIPDKNMRVSAKIERVSNEQLKVSGCALGICKGALWNRLEGALPPAE